MVTDERKMALAALPPADIDPPDEDTPEFENALLNAQSMVQIDPFAGKYLGLVVKRKVICVLVHRYMCQKTGTGATALDWT